MRTFDLSPLFRATVGYDNLARIFDTVSRVDDTQAAYPPYNIAKKSADDYRVSLAVAGFDPANIDIQVENNTLTVKAKATEDNDKAAYLHRGIAGRSFERKFELAEHIQVTGAGMDNGLLHIDLKREVPEALKPRRIAVRAGGAPVIDAPAAQAA